MPGVAGAGHEEDIGGVDLESSVALHSPLYPSLQSLLAELLTKHVGAEAGPEGQRNILGKWLTCRGIFRYLERKTSPRLNTSDQSPGLTAAKEFLVFRCVVMA